MDPQEMFDIQVFKQDPTLFYSFAKELYPSNFKPSPSHKFVKLLEDKQVLLRNYSELLGIVFRADSTASSSKHRYAGASCGCTQGLELPWFVT
jgi:hypothetical protein